MVTEHRSAILEPMIPVGWVGSEPTDPGIAWKTGRRIPTDWSEVVVSRRLQCGITVTAERRGFTVYDFAEWDPGTPQFSPGHLRTLREHSQAVKPVLVQRLRVINSHLTLLHAATLVLDGQSPSVVRVHERDLYRVDYLEDGSEGSWFQPFGSMLTTTVTVSDRHRYGSLPLTSYDRALDWLDAVISAGALTRFDLLNQTQAAVSTHDYALAVVAAWTICELSIRASAHGLTGVDSTSTAARVIEKLEKSGRAEPSAIVQLHNIRKLRNSWLHAATELEEDEALEAMQLATSLLRDIVPELAVRPTSGLLIL